MTVAFRMGDKKELQAAQQEEKRRKTTVQGQAGKQLEGSQTLLEGDRDDHRVHAAEESSENY